MYKSRSESVRTQQNRVDVQKHQTPHTDRYSVTPESYATRN